MSCVCESMLGVLNRAVEERAAGPDPDVGFICELLKVISPASLFFFLLCSFLFLNVINLHL